MYRQTASVCRQHSEVFCWGNQFLLDLPDSQRFIPVPELGPTRCLKLAGDFGLVIFSFLPFLSLALRICCMILCLALDVPT